MSDHSFVRRYQISDIVLGSAGSPQYKNIYFSLDQLYNYTELTGLYDCYKIDAVSVRFDWTRNTSSNGTNTNEYSVPMMYIVEDLDDSGTPSSVNQLLEYGSCKLHNFGSSPVFEVSLVPQIAGSAYNSITTTGYWRPKGPVWVDVGSASLPHYGLKLAAIATPSNIDAGRIVQTITMRFTCRDTR